MHQNLKDIIIAIICSGAFFSFVQFLITLYFSRKDKSKEIEVKLDTLDEKIDKNAEILARTHILRFHDEIQNGMHHSQEYFKQQLDDCDTCERYCKEHPNFKNSYTETASKVIKDTYEHLLKEGKI